MLIEFKVTNFRSINDTQTLSMVSAPIEEPNLIDNIFSSGIKDLENLVKSIAIYGANAAGKSNLIDGMEFMQSFIRDSGNDIQSSLDKLSHNLPSDFELSFVVDGVLYEYGFVLNNKQIIHEWMHAHSQEESELLFDRIYDEDTKEYVWDLSSYYFSEVLMKCPGGVEKHILNNVLFLSFAIILNNVKLSPIFNWITEKLIVFKRNSKSFDDFSVRFYKIHHNKQRIIKFLNDIDLINNGDFKFDSETESNKQIFVVVCFLLHTLDNGKVLLIDDFGMGLHPLVVRFIIELFHNPKLNKNNAQLIFTTHDGSILDNNLLRRDQVWFVEKDKQQSTKLYPLTDFKPRPNESFQKGYLEGRYGGLPFISELDF